MRPIYDLAGFFAHQIHAAEAESNRMYEPVIGIVTDNKDPQKLGRVKVKIPTISGTDNTWWAPIVMLGAGKNRGWFFIPELEDEVLVMFHHGEMTQPVVIGALWNGKDKPPDKNPGPVPHRMIKSRQGSQILFDDDKKQIVIKDGSGKGCITIDAGANKITIESLEGDVCFQAPKGEIKIVAKAMTLDAQTNVEIHAGTDMKWGAGSKTTIKSGGSVVLAGSKQNSNCGVAQAPAKPSATPKDVADPYGS